MEKLVKPARLAMMAIVVLILITVSLVTLYKLQIIDGRAYYEESRNTNVEEKTVPAARGNLMDRYGRVLVENRVCNNLVIDTVELFQDDDTNFTQANANILRLVNAVLAYGDSYTDTLPITKSPPFEYTEMGSVQRATLNAYIAEKSEREDLPADPSAV